MTTVLPPQSSSIACRVDDVGELALKVTSDVQQLDPHDFYSPTAFRLKFDEKSLPVLGFPFDASLNVVCSQGFGGNFTHFFPHTFYAIDLEVDPGTSVLAADDGVVLETSTQHARGGSKCGYLYEWNSILISSISTGLVVEYVHVSDVCVAVGARVAKGERVATSGNVGFCPSPHVHVQLTESVDPKAVPVPFAFRARDGEAFVPRAGRTYRASIGDVDQFLNDS